jgi:hypothetical protein
MQQLAVVSALVDLLADPSVQSMPVRTPADIARVLQVSYQAKYDLPPQPGTAKIDVNPLRDSTRSPAAESLG